MVVHKQSQYHVVRLLLGLLIIAVDMISIRLSAPSLPTAHARNILRVAFSK